ncbi:hypothetical protein PTSG_01596 [Salpingoeca rosetta]|uniref:Uncharacterized protein n=1 Tax=Salpingoeca rosetta (strain ATCC 50818 / BSB-021) TaxID=946362 RepID=F2TYE4_SALR5|nr:uncharacterized protein PTSG_01596 [Salpingoeca rosetta]EGD78618.1 hypothetical protein PTSG_01596 [Salpingoeca rosetta]|eukprot:XP_004997576.1 hypothetical protein PTSG_01596 [Salpingoeca rosetta]
MATTTRRARALLGVIFDLDGTLTRPHAIDFARMRARIGVPSSYTSILKYVNTLESEEARTKALDIVLEEEEAGLDRMQLNTGFDAVFSTMRDLQLRGAICTRNTESALERFRVVLEQEGLTHHASLFDPWLARDATCPATAQALQNKPHPDPAHATLRTWGMLLCDDTAGNTTDPSYEQKQEQPQPRHQLQHQLQATGEGTGVHDEEPAATHALSSRGTRGEGDVVQVQQQHQHMSTATTTAANTIAATTTTTTTTTGSTRVVQHSFHRQHPVLFVGDHIDDMVCGHSAGCLTCLLTNGEALSCERVRGVLASPQHEPVIDFVVDDGHELAQLMHALHTGDTTLLDTFAHPRDEHR